MHTLRPLVLAAVALSACGGGGSGSNAGSTTSPPTPTPSAVTFTETNAVDALKAIFGSVEQMAAATEVLSLSNQIMAGRTAATISCDADSVVSIEVTNTDPDGNFVPSVDDVLTWDQPACSGVTRHVTMTLTAVSGARIQGRVELDVELGSPVSGRVHGSFDLLQTLVPSPQTTWQATNVELMVTHDGMTHAVAMPSAERVYGQFGLYSVSIEGSVDSPRLGGRFSFATARALSGIFRSLPLFGEVILTAPSSRLRITPSSDPLMVATHADYQIAPTNAGAYDTARQVRWTDLFVGTLFGHPVPQPAQPPLIAQLSISPPSPTAGSNVNAEVIAYDANSDHLQYTFEWRRNGSVIAGATASTLLAGQHRRGDRIEVTAFVFDGVRTVGRSAAVHIGNAAPQISSAGITPNPAVSSDSLTLAAIATDADLDALQLSYEWRRNGAAIAGATGPTLPAAGNRPNDVITGTITVNDGTQTAAAEVSVTILDRPARVTVVSPPTSVERGDLLSFTARAEDPDGDDVDHLRFELDHGPAGMAVDPSSGVVTWLAEGPMFDRAMDFNWAVRVDDPTASPAIGTVTVVDPAQNYAMMRTSRGSPLIGSLAVADFDNDGDTEALILSDRGLYELERDASGRYRQSWAYPFAVANPRSPTPMLNGNMTAMAAGDIDGDGGHEIFVAAEALVVRLDDTERRVVDTAEIFNSEVGCGQLQVADLDNDDRAELVCLARNGGELVILQADDLSVRWRMPSANPGFWFDVANLDSDPALEIVTNAGYIYDGATWQEQSSHATYFTQWFDTGDVNGDGMVEMVGTYGSAIRAFSAVGSGPLWEVPINYSPLIVLVSNIDLDPAAEIIVGGYSGVTIYDYDGQTDTLNAVAESTIYRGSSAFAVADLDGDGELELLGNRAFFDSGPDQLIVSRLNRSLDVEWMTSESDALGPFVGGELARSPSTAAAPLFGSEVIGSVNYGPRLLTMNADNGDLTSSSSVGTEHTVAVTVADYDHDGTDEAFVVLPSLRGAHAAAYDLFEDRAEWTSPSLDGGSSFAAVAKADVTGDGRDDLLAINNFGDAHVFDVYGNALLWQITTQTVGKEILAADLDGDGAQELIIATSQRLSVYARVAAPIAYAEVATRALSAEAQLEDVVVGDTDGDGALEVLALIVPSNPFGQSSEVQRFDRELRLTASFTMPWRSTSLQIEPSAVARKNLLVATGTPVFTQTPSQLVAIDARSGLEVWRSPFLLGQISRNSVHYVQLGTGAPRISIGTSAGMYLTR